MEDTVLEGVVKDEDVLPELGRDTSSVKSDQEYFPVDNGEDQGDITKKDKGGLTLCLCP